MTGATDQQPETRTLGLDWRRIATGAGAALLVLAVAALAFAGSRLASPGGPASLYGGSDGEWQDPRSGVKPQDHGARGWEMRGARDFDPGRPGELPFRDRGIHVRARPAVTISAIGGTSITLTTTDGWTRTITVTDATTITKAGATITLADLQVGDTARIRQTRNDDGSYTITAIEVVLPQVTGRVTATSADTITLQVRDGSTKIVHVGSGTTYQVRGVANGTLSAISAGMVVVAQGTENADGSLEAVAVYAAGKR